MANDNEVNHMVACKFLQKLGYQPESAWNGKQAVAAFSQSKYAVVLMDSQMSEMDGFAATEEIRRLEASACRRTPIIAVTGNTSPEDKRRRLRAGMDDRLPEPVTVNVLRDNRSSGSRVEKGSDEYSPN